MMSAPDPFVAASVVTVLFVAITVISQGARGRRRLLLQRIGVYGAIPSLTAVLVLAPMRFHLTFSDGLSVAGLALTLLFAAGASFMNRMKLRLRIGVVIPSRVPFHSELRAGLNEALRGERCDLYDDYLVTNRALENLADFLPALRRTLHWRPDYLVVCSPSVSLISSEQVAGLLTSFARRGGGIIFIDNPPADEICRQLKKRYGSVTSDVETGAKWIAQFVKTRLGPGESVLVLAGPSSSAPAEVRRKMFEIAIPDATVEVADTGAWTAESTYQSLCQRLQRGERPRFVVCGNDVMAFGVVRALREFVTHNQQRGPLSVEVIGYDGIARALFAISEPSNPFCATIRTPPSAYGQEIAAMIIADARSFGQGQMHVACIPVGEGQLITPNNVELVLARLAPPAAGRRGHQPVRGRGGDPAPAPARAGNPPGAGPTGWRARRHDGGGLRGRDGDRRTGHIRHHRSHGFRPGLDPPGPALAAQPLGGRAVVDGRGRRPGLVGPVADVRGLGRGVALRGGAALGARRPGRHRGLRAGEGRRAMTAGRGNDLGRVPHHDGSERFVAREGAEPGAPATVFLVEPPEWQASSMTVRYTHDGDALYRAGEVDRVDGEGRWWRFDLPSSAGLSYRFQWEGPGGGRTHLNGEGLHDVEPTDAADYRFRTIPPAPLWAREAVAYYVFLDRFWREGPAPGPADRPLSAWTDPVLDEYPANVQQFYGGDLDGVRTRLDHVDDLGARLLVLSPFFAAPESHRYCASSFDRVDPLLGGDEALARLVAAAHERGLRCLGDLTLNHCGSTHEWFRRAVASASSPEAQLFTFVDHPHRYVAYKGVPSLPKLNYASRETHARMYAGEGAPLRRWLRPPYSLDGWRFDVAAMVGRQGGLDVNGEVARGVRQALEAERDDAFHVAEILHDPAPDLCSDRWTGSLLDAGFQSPVRTFCTPVEPDRPGARLSGDQLHRSLRRFAAALPWDALVGSVGFVGSHDLPRIRSVVGSREAALLAHFLLLTFPGIPMIYAGDELGVEGATADTGRAPLPWPGTGLPADRTMLHETAALVGLRRSSPALTHGGFRWLAATDDLLAYERCSPRQRVVCVAARRAERQRFALAVATSGAEPLLTRGTSLDVADATATCEASLDHGYGAWVLH